MEKFVKDNEDGSKTIDFSDRPLKIDGTEVKALPMREPTVQDQLTASKMALGDDAETEVLMFANLTELSPDAIKGLPMRQYKRLQVAYIGFLD